MPRKPKPKLTPEQIEAATSAIEAARPLAKKLIEKARAYIEIGRASCRERV